MRGEKKDTKERKDTEHANERSKIEKEKEARDEF